MLQSKWKPILGVGLLVFREGKILLAQRRGALGTDEWGNPGGKLEGGEAFEGAILRELAEECGEGFKIKNLRFILISNIMEYAPKHYVQVGFAADWVSGEPMAAEPEKHKDWQWFALDNLPSPLFVPVRNLLEAYESGVCYKDVVRKP